MRREIGRNMVANGTLQLVSVAVGLTYTPFVIRQLGVANYGLVPLAGSLTAYLSIVMVGVTGVVARNVTAALVDGRPAEAVEEFNLALRLALAASGVLLAVAALGAAKVTSFLNVPPGQEAAAAALVGAVALAFVLGALASPFDSYVWVANRFDIKSLFDGLALLLRNGIVVVAFLVSPPTLWPVVAGIVAAALFSAAASILACRRFVPVLQWRPGQLPAGRLRALWQSSRWVMLNQAGVVLTANLDLLLINIMLGPQQGGLYAPLLQWVVLLRGAVSAATLTLGPPMVQMYARGDFERLGEFCRETSKLAGLLMALPAALLCGLAGPLLGWWLGPDFLPMAPLAWLLLIPLCAESTQMHLGAVMLAADQTREWAIGNIVAGLLVVLLATVVVRGGAGLYGVAFAGALVGLVRNVWFTPWLTARILCQPWSPYSRTTAAVLLFTTAGAALIQVGVQTWPGVGIWGLTAWFICGGLFLAGAAFLLVLNNRERSLMRALVVDRFATTLNY